MALNWPNAAGTYINCTCATLGPAGTGGYTIVALLKPPNGFVATLSLQVGTGNDREILSDTGTWFGNGDFSGFSGVVVGDWQIIGQSKAAGSNLYRWHFWDYTTSGAKTHVNGSSGTHGDPGTITKIHLGDADNRGNGPIAVLAVWNRVLADAEFDSLCTTRLSDWAALAPDALWPLNVASPTAVLDVTGHGNNATGIVGGTITVVADPPGFDYSLGPGPTVPPGAFLSFF